MELRAANLRAQQQDQTGTERGLLHPLVRWLQAHLAKVPQRGGRANRTRTARRVPLGVRAWIRAATDQVGRAEDGERLSERLAGRVSARKPEESYKLMKHRLHDFFGRYDEQGKFIRGFLGDFL